MKKRNKQIILGILLVIVLATMYLQFKFFRLIQWWIFLIPLIIAYFISKQLQSK